MNLIPMLARLEQALGCTDLAEQILLLPGYRCADLRSQHTNLVVGYNGSPRSQSALDLTLWMAHQTRLATGCPITVQVVYVINLDGVCGSSPTVSSSIVPSPRNLMPGVVSSRAVTSQQLAIAQRAESEIEPLASRYCKTDQFDQADQILWQARHMADEWRGSLKTHLRFGQVGAELRQVAEAESASVLVLGCTSVEHPLVQQLAAQKTFPCPVLGIPANL